MCEGGEVNPDLISRTSPGNATYAQGISGKQQKLRCVWLHVAEMSLGDNPAQDEHRLEIKGQQDGPGQDTAQ